MNRLQQGFCIGAAVFVGWMPLAAQTLYVPNASVGVSSNGKVGIGTDTPLAAFDIAHRILLDYDSASYGVSILNDSAGGWARGFNFRDTNGGELVGFGALGVGNDLAYGFIGTGPLDYQSPWMVFRPDGKVGIGTTSPDAKLAVVSSGSIAGLHVNASGEVDTPTIIYENSWLTGTKWLTAIGYDGNLFLGTKVVGSSQYALAMSSSGNVGIGTTTPTHKLAVNGTIRAKEVIVDTGWADYVFADDYQLAPLDEVEAHIREKKHLPGIPSAAEVAEQGVSLSEIQSLLLAKIEELTLYQIETKREIERIKTENTELRHKVAKLEDRP